MGLWAAATAADQPNRTYASQPYDLVKANWMAANYLQALTSPRWEATAFAHDRFGDEEGRGGLYFVDDQGRVIACFAAEAALARIVRAHMTHEDEARALLRELFRADADLEPDPTAHTLTIRVHSFATPRSNRTIQHLLDCLNETEFTYPGTTLQLRYTLAASNPK